MKRHMWTRREIAGWALAAPAVLSNAGARAQTAATAPPPSDLLAKAREGNKAHAEAMAKIDLPMSTEPAFVFRA